MPPSKMALIRIGILALASGGALGCSSDSTRDEPGKPDGATNTTPTDAGGSGAEGYAGLSCAMRETVVEEITSAENMLFTSTGRLFLSGNNGVFELVRAGGTAKAVPVKSDAPCAFLGLAEANGVLYANCYVGMGQTSTLYAAKLTSEPDLQQIFEYPVPMLANGLTADGHRLLATSSLGKAILALGLSDDGLTVESHDTWYSADDLMLPNGIKVHDGAVYWTNQRQIRKTVIAADGSAGDTSVLVDEMTFFDDLTVSAAGIVAADLSAGALAAFDLTGTPIARTPGMLLDTPSSVLPALGRLGFAPTDLIATEKNGNRLAVVHQCEP